MTVPKFRPAAGQEENRRTRPRLMREQDTPRGSPVHALHDKLAREIMPWDQAVSPAEKLFYFVVAPIALWAGLFAITKVL